MFVILKKLIEKAELQALSNPVRALWLADAFWMLYPSPMVSAEFGNSSREMSVGCQILYRRLSGLTYCTEGRQ